MSSDAITQDFAKQFEDLITHPENEEIIARLIRGETVKSVSDWLKAKYPKEEQKHLRLSQKLLKDVVTTNYLSYQDQWKKDYQDIQNGIGLKKLSASLQNNKSYQERLVNFSQDKLDIKRMMGELIFIAQQRIEQVFDAIQLSAGDVGKKEYAFLQYLNNFFMMIEKYDKIYNEKPDQVIQHNINIQAVNQSTTLLQEAIREVLAEMSPELSMLFIEKLNEKLATLKPPTEEKQINFQKASQEIRLLHEKNVPQALNSHIQDAEFEP